jgi:hypothetical protein
MSQAEKNKEEKRKKFFAPLGARLNPLNVSFASSRFLDLPAIIVDGYNSPPPCSTPPVAVASAGNKQHVAPP